MRRSGLIVAIEHVEIIPLLLDDNVVALGVVALVVQHVFGMSELAPFSYGAIEALSKRLVLRSENIS